MSMSASDTLHKRLLQALAKLHQTHDQPWFTRSDIARQMGASSGKLTRRREEGLDELIEAGQVVACYRPNDGRNTRLFQLASDRHELARISDGDQRRREMQARRVAALEEHLFEALNAYVDHAEATPRPVPHHYNDISAAIWHTRAADIAQQLQQIYEVDKRSMMRRLEYWVRRGDYENAREHLARHYALLEATRRRAVVRA